MKGIIFIHGLESSGTGFKARFFKNLIPEILTPDFEPFRPEIPIEILLKKRMDKLQSLLDLKDSWIIIGSSFGGLMGALYTLENPQKIQKLVLLAPYLRNNFIEKKNLNSINVPVIIFHGRKDTVVDITSTQLIAQKYFKNLKYHIVEDDHFLHSTMLSLDWKLLLIKKV